MKVGDYIRTEDGIIDKVIIDYNGHCNSPNCNCKHVSCKYNYYDEDIIIKSSPNIIDLIEVGDYVNGDRVTEITNEYIEVCYGRDTFDFIDKKDIKSIVTKEQFENCMYIVGD